MQLPAAGRAGEAPAWPLSRPTARELEFWDREWRRPQAIMWEANGQEAEVAMYCRTLKDAEKPKASVALRTLVRQQQEVLGISLPGMLRLRWKIVAQPVGAARAAPTSDARARLKVVADAS